MRNRTWLAIIAAAAVAAITANTLLAQAQVRRRAAERESAAAAKAADRGGEASKVTAAVAVVQGLGDHKVKGKVTFVQKEDGVEITAELTGLQPGEHGFHVHEFGDCSMADGKCAGGHFNPTGAPHGAPDSDKRHVGDLGNIKADGEGKATYKRIDHMITLNGSHSVIGRSVIIHAKADDLKTQPSGDAGDRIGCGAIGIADPKMVGMAH
jgi:Cu-Zn family superoxide dismutase